MNSGGSIDFHIHLYPPDVIRAHDKIAENEPYFAALASNNVHKWATLEDLLPRMERDNVVRAVVGGFAFRDLGLCRVCNDYIIDCVKRHPDKLDGLCAVPPLARGFDEEITRCADAGLIGVGELFPEGQGIDIADISQTWRFAGAISETGMFALIHTAEPVGHNYVGKGNVGPREAAAFCMNHPDARVVFAHLGGGLWLYELMPEMKLYLSNAMYDLAALPWLYGADVLRMIEAGGLAGKFLFGTDYPILDSERYDKMLSFSGVSSETLESFRRGNATRILNVQKR
ncbi:amidohydrolase [Synergistales bacterium]|nr:amidohydrolase [Synergistales bacterium]